MADQAPALQARLTNAIAANTTYLGIVSPSVAQNTTQLQALTRQVQAMLRLASNNNSVLD